MPLSKITNPFLDSAGSARSNVYSPSANTIGIVTSGLDRVRVDPNGSVGVGTTTLTNKFNVAGGVQSSAALVAIAANTVDLSQETGYSRLASFGPDASTPGILDLTVISTSGMVQKGARIDSSGRMTKPYQPAFRVTRNVGDNTTSDQIINFDYAILNTGSHFNLATYTFTAPVAGFYFLSYGGMNHQSNTHGATLFRLHINGAQASYMHIINSHPSNASNSLVYYMNASDTAYVRGQNYHTGTGSTGNDYPYFSGYLLG